jgi:hypothetical protein
MDAIGKMPDRTGPHSVDLDQTRVAKNLYPMLLLNVQVQPNGLFKTTKNKNNFKLYHFIERNPQMTEDERKRILESSPVGTFALMAIVLGGMVIAWMFLYFGVFIPRGMID